MRFSMSVRILGACVLIALASGMFPRTAGAALVGADFVQIQVQSQGLCGDYAWLFSAPHESTSSGDPGCQYTQYDISQPVDLWDNSGTTVLGTLDMVSVLYKADPFVSLSVAVTAGAADTTFTITSGTVGFPSITNPPAYAVVSLTLTDNSGDGATLTGLYPGGDAYEASYTGSNGLTTWTTLEGTFTAPTDSSNTITDRLPLVSGTDVIDDTVSSIQSQYYFELTPYDSASGTSHFEVTPEPATLSLLALGALALLRRRRKA